jgi:hypothetical protein
MPPILFSAILSSTMKSYRRSQVAHWVILASLTWTLATQPVLAATSNYPVAGLTPEQRPMGAPRITADPPLDQKRALHGITEPVTPSIVKFLEQQGGWYTPFTLPGMPSPYDPRGWHSPSHPVHR